MLLKLVSCLAVLSIFSVSSQQCENCSCTVKLTTGKIEGHYAVINGSVVGRTFLGIPYAEPPLGPLRFAEPKSKESWKDAVLSCHIYKPACWQNRSRRTKPARISEDCLYLNVFAGNNCTASEPCPVVIFIHGGEFDFDSPSMFDPNVIHENFAMEDVIFVTVAYRLGVFGFFSTASLEAEGNFGLSDIIEAMKWIKREINAFGGDSSRVTLMGHSSGGSAVSLLTLSPKTENLMEQAIVMSGSALSPRAFMNDITPYILLAYRLGCHPLANAFKHNISAVVECMRAIPADQLDYEYTKMQNGMILSRTSRKKAWLHKPEFELLLNSLILPISEFGFFTSPRIDGADGILPIDPIILMQDRRSMPYLLGTTKGEFTESKNKTAVAAEEQATPLTLLLACKKVLVIWKIRFGRIRQNVKDCFKEYALKARMSSSSPDMFNWSAAVTQLRNDNGIFWPVYADAVTMRNAGGTVYLYSFDYVKSNFDSTPHSVDLTYALGLHKFPFNERDKKIQKVILTLLINFVKNSDPTPIPISGVTWKPLTAPDGGNYLSIDDKLEMKPFYHENGMSFWPNLFDASQIFDKESDFKRKVFHDTASSSTDMPSEVDIETILNIIFVQAEHEGRSASKNASTKASSGQSSEPWFTDRQQYEIALYWTCIALLVMFLLVGILLLICCGKSKYSQRRVKCMYEPLTGKNDIKSVPTYQTF
ncbi:carboxylesterase [Trichuris trichiura]|uniref:Carboxylesterase n=1 Tax=Trichuris trichiura TaxID=36087 RepID=A0A077Z3B9_TRITR|nr:carboxylesterase [Trichuris trichiura]